MNSSRRGWESEKAKVKQEEEEGFSMSLDIDFRQFQDSGIVISKTLSGRCK